MELLVNRYAERTVELAKFGTDYECTPELISCDIMDVRDAVRELKTCLGTSTEPATADNLTGNEWRWANCSATAAPSQRTNRFTFRTCPGAD